MKHILVEMMLQLTELTKEEELAIENTFPIKIFKKGTHLLKQGQIVKDGYFIIKGCIRDYILIDGEEKTTAFFTENQSAVNYNNLLSKKPSKQNFICSEDTTVAIFNGEKEKEFYHNFPRFEVFCRAEMEDMLGEKQKQLAEYITLKPEQRYLKLLKERPNLLNRVPQYQIASYLGIKPETLSRIRNRVVSKFND